MLRIGRDEDVLRIGKSGGEGIGMEQVVPGLEAGGAHRVFLRHCEKRIGTRSSNSRMRVSVFTSPTCFTSV